MDFWQLLYIIDGILFIATAGTVLYLGIFSIASLFNRTSVLQKAKKQMLARCMTRENVHIAQYNAVEEITRVFKAMGFEYVDVHF